MIEVCDTDKNNAIQTHVDILPEVACSCQTLMNSLCKVVEPSSPRVCLSLPHDPDAGVLLSFLPDGERPLNLAFHSDYVNCLLFFFPTANVLSRIEAYMSAHVCLLCTALVLSPQTNSKGSTEYNLLV